MAKFRVLFGCFQACGSASAPVAGDPGPPFDALDRAHTTPSNLGLPLSRRTTVGPFAHPCSLPLDAAAADSACAAETSLTAWTPSL